MKLSILISLVLLAFLTSCSPQSEELTLTSPEKNITLNLKANKPGSLEPWNVTMEIAGYEKSRSLTFDMYNGDFNTETVKVDWKNENEAVITFMQSDGDHRVMDLFLNAEQIQLQER